MFIEQLKKIGRNSAWSLISVVLAVILGGLAIYAQFFRDERPAIQFEILSDSSVLDVREDVSDLEIIYAGSDLRKSGQSLRVIVVRVSNVGSEDILNSFYDISAPLGLSVDNGELISVELENASEDYLREQLAPSVSGRSEVVFAPVILATNAYFSLRILVIHTESMAPRLSPIGKVARVSSISLIEAQSPQPETFWRQTFGGPVLSQITRLLPYSVATVALVALGVSVPLSLSSALSKRRRKGKVRLFKKNSGHDFKDQDDVFFTNYIASGPVSLGQVEALLSKDVDLDEIADSWKKRPSMPMTDGEMLYSRRIATYDRVAAQAHALRLFPHEARWLFENGIVEEVDGHYKVNSRFEEIFRGFQKFLSLVAE